MTDGIRRRRCNWIVLSVGRCVRSVISQRAGLVNLVGESIV
jgi:hypothetical protein